MAISLTEGAIAMMLSGGDAHLTDVKPVLQVTDLRLVNTQNQASERYQILLSDGSHLQKGILGIQNNELVRSHILQKGSIVQLTQFTYNFIQGHWLFIIIDLNVILDKCNPIGDPKHHEPKKENVGKMSRAPLNNSYGRPPQETYQQPPPMYTNRGPVANNEAPPQFSLKMGINLTEGAIAMLLRGDAEVADVKPVVQVADLGLVNTKNQAEERYWILLSDGSHLRKSILGHRNKELVQSHTLQKGSIVQLTQFTSVVIQGRMIIIIIDLNVIFNKCDPIGEPKPYELPVTNINASASVGRSSAQVLSTYGGFFASNPDSGRYKCDKCQSYIAQK